MIAWFPTPYPDETFDSLCYRYAERMRYPHKNALGEDLFGERIEGVSVDVPNQLAYFVAHLPPGSQITAAQLIENHSFLPYYRPFLASETYTQVVAQIMGDQAVPNILGALSKFRKHVPIYLRYCPQCVTADRREYGETYWHRQHQLPGMCVCAEHAVWLEDSPAYAKHGNFSLGPLTAETACQRLCISSRTIGTSPTEQRLWRLSQNSHWILTQPLNLDAEALFQKYRLALREKGYLNHAGFLRRRQFLQDFQEYYSSELLSSLGCEFSSHFHRRLTWVKHLVEQYHPVRFSPLQHLLRIQFLSEEAHTFFALSSDERQPFGTGPWPCLNKTCPHYRQPVIGECRIYYNNGKPRAEFQCTCGFTYRRWGTDQSEESRYSYDWVCAYGSVWDDKLRELWNETDISLNRMKKALGLGSTDAIKCHALRLNLPFQKQRDVAQGSSIRVPNDQKTVERIRQQRLVAGRQQIMELLQNDPTLIRQRLHEQIPATMQDIRKFDPEWLNQVVPVSQPAPPKTINWSERDEKLAQKIPLAAQEIQSQPGKPIRITRAEIGRRIAAAYWFANNLPRLPKTKTALDTVLESRQAFAMRRLLWARDYFVQRNEVPRWWALVQKAGVEKSLYPDVMALAETLLIEMMAAVGEPKETIE